MVIGTIDPIKYLSLTQKISIIEDAKDNLDLTIKLASLSKKDEWDIIELFNDSKMREVYPKTYKELKKKLEYKKWMNMSLSEFNQIWQIRQLERFFFGTRIY